MPRIQFVKNIPPITVESGANLMRELQAAGLPVASSCNGDGICGKCRMRVISGKENLSPQQDVELTVRDRLKIPPDQRISCQARVIGDIVIDASYW